MGSFCNSSRLIEGCSWIVWFLSVLSAFCKDPLNCKPCKKEKDGCIEGQLYKESNICQMENWSWQLTYLFWIVKTPRTYNILAKLLLNQNRTKNSLTFLVSWAIFVCSLGWINCIYKCIYNVWLSDEGKKLSP